MSPFLTVGVLTVLWLIVVVPMIVRRNDEATRERNIRQFGRAMRALGRRSDTHTDTPVATASDPELFVPGSRQSDPGLAVRRPVPAAQEALMHPVDRSEMSAARAAMMTRRRRSLTVLVIGSLVTTLFALVAGGVVWLFSLLFLAGLAGYLLFLRGQARRARERRADRRARWTDLSGATPRESYGYDASEDPEQLAGFDETVVRIDDDDIHLQTMDTIDLTGLYPVEAGEPAIERKAS